MDSVQLDASPGRSTDGYFVLSWDHPGLSADESPVFLLEESTSGRFEEARQIYRGPDKSRVMSGKPDGQYQYRIHLASPASPATSNVVVVDVAHHSLARASFFFILGLVVFVATLATVLRGEPVKKEDL